MSNPLSTPPATGGKKPSLQIKSHSTSAELPRLETSSYQGWLITLRTYLRANRLLHTIEEESENVIQNSIVIMAIYPSLDK